LGLIIAIAVIFLMLAANFQSFKVSLVVLSTVPAVLLGSLTILLLTGSTLNLQSYMGIIMSVGVSIANSVLLITNAEPLRRHSECFIKCKGIGSPSHAPDFNDQCGHGGRNVAHGLRNR
jgi:multidrug efflux pump subunit AcrB